MSLASFKFTSQYLHQATEVSLILPDMPREQEPREFYDAKRKYPVVWLLHGGYDDNSKWWRRSRVELYACERNVAVVMPSGYNAYYQNWPSFGMGMNVYDYITKELMYMLPAWFPLSEAPEDNYIFGLSMGAGGAVNICARNPERFAGVACLAGLVDDIRPYYAAQDHAATIPVGNQGGLERYLASDYNNWRLLKENASRMPPLYYACGTEDHNYTKTFARLPGYAAQIGLKAEFVEVPGLGHEWRFWDKTVEMAMDYFGLKNNAAGNLF